jgi:YVTN family beta-propeller protein
MPYAYVSNLGDGTVSVIDTVKLGVVGALRTGDEPFGLALTPDKSLLFVTLKNVGVVRILDATNIEETQQVGIADVGGEGASARGIAIAVTSSDTYAIVVSLVPTGFGQLTTPSQGYLWQIDTTTFAVEPHFSGPPGYTPADPLGNPYCLALHAGPDGLTLYTTDAGSGTQTGCVLVSGSPAGPTLLQSLTTEKPQFCSGVAVTPEGVVYVGNNGVFWDWTVNPGLPSDLSLPGKVIVARESLCLGEISVGSADSQPSLPAGIVVSPDGHMVYVALYGANQIVGIDTTTQKVTFSSPATFNGPLGLAVTPDGHHLYAANNRENTVTVLDLWELDPPKKITVGQFPCFIAM